MMLKEAGRYLYISENILKKHQNFAQEGVHFRVPATNLYQKSSKLCEIWHRDVFAKYLEVFFSDFYIFENWPKIS